MDVGELVSNQPGIEQTQPSGLSVEERAFLEFKRLAEIEANGYKMAIEASLDFLNGCSDREDPACRRHKQRAKHILEHFERFLPKAYEYYNTLYNIALLQQEQI